MKKYFIYILLSFTLSSYANTPFTDETFDDNIRTVQMRNVIPVGTQTQLTFDYLGGDGPYMIAKIIHCNWDWTPSVLMEIEFMNEFNEFRLNDVAASSSPYIPYYHYHFDVPKLKLSGNYIIVIFDEDQPKKKYMYRRLSIYEDKLVLNPKRTLSKLVKTRFTHQQIDVEFHYGSYDIQDPYQNLNLVIRQNQRWDNAKTNLKPSYINEAKKLIQFNFFEGQTSFFGGTEYRQFFIGQNIFGVDDFEKTNEGVHYYLREDINRSNLNYSDWPDNNGYFDIEHPYTADYSHVHFSLKSQQIDEDVYIFGQLSDWQLDKRFKLNYDSIAEKYTHSMLIKNGEYDFSYAVDKEGIADEFFFQGSHSETRNTYDVLVYYRPFGKMYDKIIGFKRLD